MAVYKRIVASKVRRTFDEINRGNTTAMTDGLAPTFTYLFHGDSALGGRRTTRAAVDRWWSRIGRLLPDAHFTVHDVVVQGHPGHTKVATRVEVTAHPNGEDYTNVFMQHMTLRFGRVTSVETLEDTARLDRLLQRLAGAGLAEASAAPIVD